MKSYNTNITGTHKIMITLQCMEYKGHLWQTMDGNCYGREVLGFDFYCEDGECENDCQLTYHEDYDCFSAILNDENGNTLKVEGDGDEMNNMIVALEIVDFSEQQD